MDALTFDRLVAEAARRPTRRTALGLLAGGLFGLMLRTHATAQRLDSDQDGLFDDDELRSVEEGGYATNPNDADTDDDGVSDGQEVFNNDNGLGGNTNPRVNENAAPPPAEPAPPPAATCIALGGQCVGIDLPCCGNDPATFGYNNVVCCTDLTGAGVCTDITGTFHCPDPGVPAAGCPGGMIDCGGFCTDVLTDHGNCGFCGNACPFGSNCTNGDCAVACPAGQTYCGYCTDLLSDQYNCGTCHILCDSGVCRGGACAPVCFGGGTLCTDDSECCSRDCGLDEVLGAGVCV